MRINDLLEWFGLTKEQWFKKHVVEHKIDSYIKEKSEKHKVVLHHTAGPTGISAIRTFKRYRTISTPYIIDRDGTIFVLYDDQYWSYHLGIKKNTLLYVGFDKNINAHEINVTENKHSIGIELVSWGPLYNKNGKFYSWSGQQVDHKEVYEIKPHTAFGETYNYFRTYPHSKFFKQMNVVGKPARYYHAFTIQQLVSLYVLLNFIAQKHGSHLLNIHTQNTYELFYPSKLPYESSDGLFTHACYRYDKSDPFPQEQLLWLIDYIKTINEQQTNS